MTNKELLDRAIGKDVYVSDKYMTMYGKLRHVSGTLYEVKAHLSSALFRLEDVLTIGLNHEDKDSIFLS